MSYGYPSVAVFSSLVATSVAAKVATKSETGLCATTVQATKPLKLQRSAYKTGVSLLRDGDSFLQQHPEACFWRLLPYYVGQQTEASCSLASALMTINAAHDGQRFPWQAGPLTEDNFFKHAPQPRWRRETRDDGAGVTLREFALYLKQAFTALGSPQACVELVSINELTPAAQLAKFRSDLLEVNNQLSFMIANFAAGSFIDSYDFGHHSPVAAYDQAKKRVLILDVYRREVDPYWVDESLLLKSMAKVDAESGHARGYVKLTLPKSTLRVHTARDVQPSAGTVQNLA